MKPGLRVYEINEAQPRADADYVLYWMIASRRTRWSFALDRAVAWARELGKPLLVFEALRAGYPWASDRLHRFVLDGMSDNAARCAAAGVAYFPYVEPEPGAGKGLLAALAERACAVVTDDFPSFFLRRMVAAAGRQLPVLLEAVDGNGLLPLRASDRLFHRAVDMRRHLQKTLPAHLFERPRPDPLRDLPTGRVAVGAVGRRWARAGKRLLAGAPAALAKLPIDHSVEPAPLRGGAEAAEKRLRAFLRRDLDSYEEGRKRTDTQGTSGLSPYLHFGHISSHEIVDAVLRRENWSPDRLGAQARGARQGWWGIGSAAESFIDELVTWRELGFNTSAQRDDAEHFDSLPQWAQLSLLAHAHDERPHLYNQAQLARAETHAELWNAAQRQLLQEGHMHNYLRMLWGKKILEWTRSPQQALAFMFELNNRYALDGRDPNSTAGIMWILGRYDRAWGPERPIFGKVRYMSIANTLRKLDCKVYLAKYGNAAQG